MAGSMHHRGDIDPRLLEPQVDAQYVLEYLFDAHCVETNNADILQVARAFEADLALRQGRLEEASHWARKFHTLPFQPIGSTCRN